MKLSLAWIFDHIKGSWKEYDIQELVSRINSTTAEIEHSKKILYGWSDISVVRVTSINERGIVATSDEWKTDIILPVRADSKIGSSYLVKKSKKQYEWVTLEHLNSSKDGYVPAVAAHKDWKKGLETEDYILTLDNKSITHRPDLWGHRGFAREVAALLNLPLLPEERFLEAKPIKHYESSSLKGANHVSLEIVPNSGCDRLAGMYIADITQTASTIFHATRLSRIDARPINALVDCTNYVMYDIGQPMHAFDAAHVHARKIIARPAHAGEKIKLLDGETIELRTEDCVISDDKNSLALAGIMGGFESRVTESARQIIVESAHFDPTHIRKTAHHFKKRTEASARFEKNLDPYQNTVALCRFLKLMNESGISYQSPETIISLGSLAPEKILTISHDFIIKRIGASISSDVIVSILTKLGFGVQLKHDSMLYTITVPSFRATKDIAIKEDIVEEIARMYGYGVLTHSYPSKAMKPFDIDDVMRTRSIKHYCAYALKMHEVANYALYDEHFLQRLGWEPEHAVMLKNPVSEHYMRMVTSLIPHLIKNVYDTHVHQADLNFFECARTWTMDTVPQEYKKFSGIFFSQQTVDFYTIKNYLQSLFNAEHLMVTWQKPVSSLDHLPWFDPYQTAELMCDGTLLGYVGMLMPTFLRTVVEGQACAFELDGNFLIKHPHHQYQFQHLSKYPSVSQDISLLVDSSVLVSDIEMAIAHADARIRNVILRDFFEKKEWGNKRSVTLRYIINDEDKTMTKEEIEAIIKEVYQAVQKLGATIR